MSDGSTAGKATPGKGAGIAKGLLTTAKALTRRAHTHQYPDVQPELPQIGRAHV